jgi:glycerol-3-phosphate acyltransferase PlsY
MLAKKKQKKSLEFYKELKMETFILLIVAYLLGSIPSGLWIGKKFYNKNIRELGSGNTGTTNTFRVLGIKAGVVVLLCDVLKGTLATLLPTIFGIHNVSPLIFGLLAIIGHTFPIFAHFKGGKAVATSAGLLLGYQPWFFVYMIVVFLITLYITSMVSFSSITAAIFAVLGVSFFPNFHFFVLPNRDWLLFAIILFLATFIIVRHKDNLKRIKNGTENTVNFGLNIFERKK